MKISKERIERFVLTLAFFNEAYPSKDRVVNEYWGRIRGLHKWDCLKYGKCEVCGEEGLLGEYGLNWVCDDPDCLKEMGDWYDGELGL